MIRMIETGLLFISPNHMQDLYLGTYSVQWLYNPSTEEVLTD